MLQKLSMTQKNLSSMAFDLQTRSVTGPGGALELPRRELLMFEAMVLAQGRVVSKAQLLDAVYGVGADVEDAKRAAILAKADLTTEAVGECVFEMSGCRLRKIAADVTGGQPIELFV